MSAPVIIPFAPGEKPTAERLQAMIDALADKFGNLGGTDFSYPLELGGDLDLGGNRLLRAREMFGVLNMEEFGTDHDAFEQAINELTNGGVIFLPRNTTITLDRSIKIRSNRQRVYIVGSGHSSQLTMAASSDDRTIVVDGGDRVHMSNFYINGNGNNNRSGGGIEVRNTKEFDISNVWIGGPDPSTGTSGPGIRLLNCVDFSVKRCWIRNTKGSGVVVAEGCSNGDIQQVTVRDSLDFDDNKGHGIVVSDSSDIRVHACHVVDPASDGIKVTNSKRVRVYSNGIRVTTTEDTNGILLSGEGSDNRANGMQVDTNQIVGFTNGIRVGSWVQGSVISNQVVRNTNPIVYDGDKDTQVVFRNNQAFFAPHHGVATIAVGLSFVDIDIGKSNLPLQAIHATWKYSGKASNIQDAVPATAYGVNGPTIVTISIATTVAFSGDLWYSIFI